MILLYAPSFSLYTLHIIDNLISEKMMVNAALGMIT